MSSFPFSEQRRVIKGDLNTHLKNDDIKYYSMGGGGYIKGAGKKNYRTGTKKRRLRL